MVCSGGFPVILTSEVIVVFKHFQRTFHQLLVLWMCLMRQCTSEESTIIAEEEIQSNQTVVVSTDDDNSSKVLSRRKRYIVFPEGASFSVIWMGYISWVFYYATIQSQVAVCMTIGMYGNPNYQMFSWALNWGIAYNLPNQTISFEHEMKEPKPMAQRRHRRDLYHKLEVAMNE